MAFDPTQPFEVVEDPQAQAGGAPRFDPSQAFEVVDDGQTGLIEGVGNSLKRGWTMSQMAREMEKPAPDPQRVVALQQEMQAVPPSEEYMTVMDDRRAPEESWTAFKSAPVKVLAELMGESFSAFAGQMIEKAPNRVAIGLGAGAAMGAPVAGIGAVPGGFIGAGAGFAEASGAASYSLEMAGGVLEAMEQAGVPLDNPEALSQALQDPQRMQLARDFAQRKAVPVAIFDGASAVIGGRMFGGGKVASAMQRLGQGMAETFTQAAMGASGEASGQLAQSGEITSGRAILAEGVAEIPTGLVEIGAGQLSQAGATANQPAAATAPAAAPAAAAPQPAPFTPPPAAETVVVEEVFGEPTTAAAEPVAAAPAFDPSQDFEVVQEPSETIVTEPAAAAEVPPRVQELKAKLAEADPMFASPEFWQPQDARGYDGAAIANLEQTLKNFTKPKKSKGKKAAPAQANPVADIWEKYDSTGEIDSVGALADEVEGFLVNSDNAQLDNAVREYRSAAKTDFEEYAGRGEDGYTDRFVNAVQQAAQQPAPMPVQERAAPKRKPTPLEARAKKEGYELVYHGDRNEPGNAEYQKWSSPNLPLFTAYDKESAEWFGSARPLFVKTSRVATQQDLIQAAQEQGVQGEYTDPAEPVSIPEIAQNSQYEGTNINDLVYIPRVRQALADKGFDAVRTWDQLERDEVDTLIVIGSPDQVVDPADTPAKRSRARIKKMTAQSGAIDLSIVEDLVEYGKTVYRAGMSFGKWAGQMVKEFGQGIASFLKQAFDRIVEAYQNSIYSDETGAIGGRRPVRFKRSIAQLEELAKDSAAFKKWFDNFRVYLETDLLAEFPEYAPLVNEFLSATSAATSVSANVPIMLKELKHFLETGQIRTNFQAHAANLKRAVAGQKLEGPKISEYSDAVFGNPDAIPVDRHIAQIMFGVKAPSDRQIEAAKRRIREIATRLGWQPRQVMAALWAANQKLNKQPSESYERHLERFKKELLSILAQDRSGEGRGIQASRRIADRISAAGRAAGSPGDGARAAKARIGAKITSESGGIDLSIVDDLVEYGATVYRAGMSFGTWASQMVREFGQKIASFLRQSYDRIVQAYKDSPYSDTTGAVGDVRPKAKPRQFEQKAAQAPGLSEEARAQMGDDPYVPITLRGVAEQAKAWIGENGIEAAERRILGLADEGQTPTPLDFAIGLELTANLSAMRQNNRAASVVRTMSRRATSLGQTISTLAMLSRLTPEGIVFYANQIIEQHISSLTPERQAEIRAAQDDVANLEETVATTRKRTAEDAIIKGEQGGEKIQDKLKRRIPDKTQKQQTNVNIRSVLTSQATKAEATKQIAQILTESGISQSEATALATAITSRFYKVLEDARKALATSRKPAKGKGRVTIDKLLAQLKDGKIADEEFVSTLAQVKGVPALTAADKARIQSLATQYKASTDDQISLVLAARLFEEVHSIIPPDFWVKLRALSYLSMLFAPKTWIRNIGGNQIQWIANAGRDAVINMVVDPTMSLLTGRRTSAFGSTKRLRSLLTPFEDVIRGYKWNQQQNPSASFAENARAGIEHLRVLAKMTTQNKFEITDAKEVGRRIFSSKFMASWETALSIALGGGDRGFWMSAFTASLGQREAAAKKNGEWTGQPTPEDIEAAYADAMRSIYQNPNVISQSANRIRAALNRISTFGRTDQFGLGTALLAFTQVPGSITMRGLIEWSPLGMINALYEGMRPLLYKATNGKGGGSFRQEQFNKAFTQALLGSGGLFVGGYWLYALGVVTASREEDDDLEAMRRASGLGGYRVNLSALKRLFSTYTKQEPEDGDLIVSYDWAQPLAITFAAGAELAKQVEQNDREGIKKGLAGKAGMAAISLAAGAKSLEEQPLLSGLSSFMKTWGYSGPLDAVVNTVSGIPSMFVPQLVRQANQLMDNTVRETRGDEGVLRAFSRIAANTPGVADQFPPRMDIMGQAIERYQYAGNTVFNVLINPTMTSRVKTNPALQEVARLMQSTGQASQAPRQVGRSVAINGENVNLSNEQISAYQYYLGNYTMSMFNWRMASPRYARLPDTEKVRELAQDLEDVNAATKSALFGHDVNRLTRRQRVMRANLVNSPLGQSMPPR